VRIQTGTRAVAMIAAIALLAGCSGSSPSASPAASTAASVPAVTEAPSVTAAATEVPSASPAATGKSFIYISPDPLGGNPFLQLGKDATDAAAAKFGGTSKTFESTDQDSMRSNLDAAVAEKPDVIVLNTFKFTDLAKEYAEANPGQQFILIDACPTETTATNLHCGVFREFEPSYLLGYEAGLLTKTNKVGNVVAVDIPFLHRYSDSFNLGAKASNPSAEGSQLFVGGQNPFTDVAKAKELALQLNADGVDSIFAVGDYGGTFEAAKEKGFDAYGVDYNECGLAPGHVADGTIKRLDVVVATLADQIFAGNAPAVASFGLKEDGMDIVSLAPGAESSGCRVMGFPDIVAKLKDIRQQIVDGQITIPDPLAQ
jgi:basic membrane protein A and related proteins